jgi:hypothetical protein
VDAVSAHHHPADTDLQHDPLLDVTTAHQPTPAQTEVIDLLDLNPERRRVVRLSLDTWRHIDAIATRLTQARKEAA